MNKKRFGVGQPCPILILIRFNPRSYREGYLKNQTAAASERLAGCPPLFMGILPKPSLLSGSLLMAWQPFSVCAVCLVSATAQAGAAESTIGRQHARCRLGAGRTAWRPWGQAARHTKPVPKCRRARARNSSVNRPMRPTASFGYRLNALSSTHSSRASMGRKTRRSRSSKRKSILRG